MSALAYPTSLTRFLTGKAISGWVEHGPMLLYVRMSVHAVDGRVWRTFDLANLDIPYEDDRGKGTFKKMVVTLCENLPSLLPDREALYVENVLNPRLADHLRNEGWVETGSTDTGDLSFLKVIK